MHLICHSKSHCNENERFCVHEFPNMELLSQRAGLFFYICCYILAKCFLEGQYLPQWKSVSAVARIRDNLLSAQHRSSMWWAQWVTAIMSKQVLFDPLARWAPVDPFSSRPTMVSVPAPVLTDTWQTLQRMVEAPQSPWSAWYESPLHMGFCLQTHSPVSCLLTSLSPVYVLSYLLGLLITFFGG